MGSCPGGLTKVAKALMRCVVINLPEAKSRREAFDREARKVGLNYEFWRAVASADLTDADRSIVDYTGRSSRGLRKFDDPAVACLVSHLSVFRDLVESQDSTICVLEDDAQLDADFPCVLHALEDRDDRFDIVKLQRLLDKPFYPVVRIGRNHSLGRVKYYDKGGYGYVITRRAAQYLLNRFPTTYWEIDQLLPRFWDNGLSRVFYVDPPVVFHNHSFPSSLDEARQEARAEHRRIRRRRPWVAARRAYYLAEAGVRRWILFRKLQRQDRNSRWGEPRA